MVVVQTDSTGATSVCNFVPIKSAVTSLFDTRAAPYVSSRSTYTAIRRLMQTQEKFRDALDALLLLPPSNDLTSHLLQGITTAAYIAALLCLLSLHAAYLDMSKPRSVAAPIQGLPKPTRETRRSFPGNGTDAASVGGGNLDLDALVSLRPLPLVLLPLIPRRSPGRDAD